MQNEWDTLMLETYTLKQHLESTRQELAHALYQHDAACRVIARLIKERDEARGNLGNTQENVSQAIKKAGAMDVDDASGGMTEALKVMMATAKRLTKGRKKRIKQLAGEVASRDKLKKYSCSSSHPLHSSTQPGILCLDIHPTNQDMVMTGGVDNNAILFNKATGKIVDTLKGHKKKVSCVKFHPTEKMVFTTSHDNTGAIWTANSSGKYSAQHILKTHSAEVVGCTLHPSGSYLVTASADKTWAFHDVATGTCRTQFSDDKIDTGYTNVTFHPDGLILGASTADDIVRIFSLQDKLQNVANFKGHAGKVTAMSFSENGYFLASGDEKGVVKLWDLRHLKNFHTITSKSGACINDLQFDASGSYLSVASDGLSTYTSKSWELVKTWSDHSSDVTAVAFGNNADFFATTSLDRTLKIFTES
jgi:pre-mRNA-processing factor 19